MMMYTIEQQKVLIRLGLDPTKEYSHKRKEKISCWDNPIWLEIKKNRPYPLYAIKKKYKDTSKVFESLGCSHDVYKNHIEKQFLKGMTWENQGEWVIDHIIPISSAKTVEEVKVLSKFTNLRPLWRKDNRKKHAKKLFLI